MLLRLSLTCFNLGTPPAKISPNRGTPDGGGAFRVEEL